MSWQTSRAEEERQRFLQDWLKREYGFSELCLRYGISRKTGYKLVNRFRHEGEGAVIERSRARHFHPNATPPDLVNALLRLKFRYPYWGPKKLRDWLEAEFPEETYPAASTIGELLKRHGLVKPRKRCKRVPAYGEALQRGEEANDVWCADFKGQFRLGNNNYCYPLTVTDNYSRYLLGCEGLQRPTYEETKGCFERWFKEYGLPNRLRTDNGTPFASTGLGGLSRLSIWWIKLGILPERIRAGHPEENGQHERMHRALKEATANPACEDFVEQQYCFDSFKQEYNEERSHEGIGRQRPNQLYVPSLREYPTRFEEISYPDHFEIRRVRSNGEIKWAGKKYFASELLWGEPLGFQLIDEGRAIIYFAQLKVGIIDARLDKIIRPG